MNSICISYTHHTGCQKVVNDDSPASFGRPVEVPPVGGPPNETPMCVEMGGLTQQKIPR